MGTLHIVNRVAALAPCLDTAATADAILLIEDGVYAATQDQPRECFAIDMDIQARGIASRITAETSVINYADFVELTVKHNPIVTWC